MSNAVTEKADDGFAYKWVIVATCLFVTILGYGTGYTFGVYLNPLREAFHAPAAVIAGAYSVCLFFYSSFGSVTGWTADKYGPRNTVLAGGFILCLGLLLTSRVNAVWQLYLTYVLIGIGISILYTPMMVTVSRWFDKRRGLALGLVSAGTGIGPVIVAPLARHLISLHDWRFTYVAFGLAAGLIVPAAFLLRSNPSISKGSSPGRKSTDQVRTGLSEPQEFSLKDAFHTRPFWLLCSLFLIVGLGDQVLFAHIPAHGETKGLTPMQAATLISMITGGGVLGRISSGGVSDIIGRKKTLGICIFLEGSMIMAIALAPNTWTLFLFTALFGIGYGGHAPQFPALTGELFGLSHMGAILGAEVFFWGIGGSIGPYVAGYIFDVAGSYFIALTLSSAILLLGASTIFFIKSPQRRAEAGVQIEPESGVKIDRSSL